MSKPYDVIVVGLGAMGSATCYHLAKRGARVLGLERYDVPHALGSSHGFSRAIRTAYKEHPDYVPLAVSAFNMWKELEAESGQKLMHATGVLYMGPADGPAASGVLLSAKKYALPYEELSHADLARRYPQFHLPDHFIGIMEKMAGFLMPEKAVAAHALQALLLGAEMHGREAVTEWSEDASGVTVRTERASYRADHVVFCGGAWSDRLVGDLGVRLRVSRQVLAWVWPKRPDMFELGRLPVWTIQRPDGSTHYGFPMMPDNPGFKIAHHYHADTADPDNVDRSLRPADEADVREILRVNIPEADGPLLSSRVCLYTNSPDHNFIVDRHPAHERVILACGFSGHGFKFATVMGQILADLATAGKTAHPIGFLGLSRFGKSS